MKQFKSFNILSLILVEGNGEWLRQEMTLVRGGLQQFQLYYENMMKT